MESYYRIKLNLYILEETLVEPKFTTVMLFLAHITQK